MKTQFTYAIADIWRKKTHFILFFIQLIIIIVLITISYFLILKKEVALDFLEANFDTSNSYYMSLHEKYSEIDIKTEDNIFKELDTYIKENANYSFFSAYADYLKIDNMPTNSLSIIVTYGPDKVPVYNTLTVSTDFISIFALSLAEGDFFSADWQYVQGESIPVVLGYDYQEFLKLHDKFTDDNNINYEVIGFLQQGSSFVDISSGDGRTILDNVILIPIDVTVLSELYETGNYDYESYFEGATLITKDRSDLTALRTITEQSKNFTYQFKSLSGVSKYMEVSTKETVSIYLFVAVLCTILATSLIIVNTLEFVQKNLREFSIHIFCGATRADISLRIFFQIFFVWLLALVGSFLFNYFVLKGSVFIILIVAGTMLLFCLGACVPSFINLFSLQISTIIRRK